jgi:hypothetical protein
MVSTCCLILPASEKSQEVLLYINDDGRCVALRFEDVKSYSWNSGQSGGLLVRPSCRSAARYSTSGVTLREGGRKLEHVLGLVLDQAWGCGEPGIRGPQIQSFKEFRHAEAGGPNLDRVLEQLKTPREEDNTRRKRVTVASGGTRSRKRQWQGQWSVNVIVISDQ